MRHIHLLTLVLAGSFILPPSSTGGQGEQVRFKRLPKGLSQSSVNTILQDRRGFMWFGTQDGLNRFDGYSYAVFRHHATDTNSLPDNYIWSLAEDGSGDLWIGTLNGGLSRYGSERGVFRNYVHAASDTSSLSNNNVTAVCRGTDGEIYVGTWGGGLQQFDRTRNAFRRIPLASDRVRCLCSDKSGSLWVGTWNGLEKIDPRGTHEARYVHDSHDPGSLSGDRIISLCEDRAGSLWVGTFDAGLEKFDHLQKKFLHYPHSADRVHSPGSDAIRCLSEDGGGEVWIGTLDAGVDRFDPASGQFTHFHGDTFDQDGLPSNRIFSLFNDRTGAIWVGSGDAGVVRYDPLAQNFAHLRTDPTRTGSPGNNVVRAILETARGELWIGTFGGGLNRRMPGEAAFTHFLHDRANPSSIGSDAVLALFEDSRHQLWVGTADAGLDLLDRDRRRFRHFRHDAHDTTSLSNDAVMTITEDRTGNLWIGTSGGGADRLEISSGRFSHFRPGREAGTGGDNVWAIHEDRAGSVWMGTWGEGLHRCEPGTGRFTPFLHNPGTPGSLSNNTVWSMYEDPAGFLWLGTWGGGLNRLDPRTGSFRAWMEKDGLPNNVVYGILPDDKGNLWLSTNRGVAKFNPGAGSFRNYDVLDGLQADEFNQGAYCRGRDGTLYFGGVNGVTAFHPDSLRDNPDPPPIVITGFQVFNRPLFPDAIPGADGVISLSSNDNFFSLEFAALNYTAPEKNLYAYRLEGLEQGWVYSGSRRYVSYAHLRGGDYVFRVKGSNSDGVWNDEGISLRLHIDPPFYLTWWFLLAAASCVVSGTYALYRMRLVKLLDLERLRTRIASDLHDDIGSGLTRIAVLSDVAARQADALRAASPAARAAGDPGEVTRAIGKVGVIARELIDAMSDVVWSIDPRHDSAGSLMHRVKVYALELCEAKNIALTFETPGEKDPPGLSPEIMREVLLVAKEAVTNIVKHSGCSHARIRLVPGKKEISLDVEDDGNGFAATAPPAGNGLASMRARAAKAGGTFTVDSAPGRGTRIRLSLPTA